MLFAVCLMTAMTAALLCINPQHRVMDVALPDNNLFVINLWWAGAWRRVVIDGNLPVDQWGRTVFASCEDHSRFVFVACCHPSRLRFVLRSPHRIQSAR